MFVVQKHAATRLHYDFRLEMEGVLKSWAVPKGFPTQRGDRRLAIEVEDHPIEYGDFEGIIPPGNYGAGTVMVWDTGSYEVSGGEPVKALRQGKLHLFLEGKKLKGEWTLVRTRGDNPDKPQWLLMKTGSDTSPLSQRMENQSALTSRTLDQIAAAGDRAWQSDRPAKSRFKTTLAPGQLGGRAQATSKRSLAGQGTAASEPIDFIEPMKAQLVNDLPTGANWLYELKLDGIRVLALMSGKSVRLLSRSANDLTLKYPQVAESLKKLSLNDAILDGEIVALDAEGRPSFQLLQCYQIPGGKKPPLFYYVFDLLRLNGRDLRELPLIERKEMAEALISENAGHIRFSAGLQAVPSRLIEQMRKRGLEGLIAKQKNSKYESGRRSGAWLKYKWSNEQEFVIGGYTSPKGSRSHFGAILVGYYDAGKLIFAAKVGTGFAHKLLSSLFKKFQGLISNTCPFANLPEKSGSRAGGLSTSEMRRCSWLKPELVCQVRFAEWTRDGHLRQPAFMGLREDKRPRDVVRESAAPPKR